MYVGCLSWVERIDLLFSSIDKTVSHSMHIIGKQMNLCLVWTGPKIFLLFSDGLFLTRELLHLVMTRPGLL